MAAAIRRGLRFEGLVVDLAGDGEEGLRAARATAYDVIVLDVMMPGLDGFETCSRMRETGIRAPVLMLTARDAVEDRVRGLDGGADDYLTKPFSLSELTARLRALVRRGPIEQDSVLEVGDLRLDPATREVHRGEAEIELSAREFALLETFMRRPGSGAWPTAVARVRLGPRLRAALERGRGLRALPAREDRSALRREVDRNREGRRLPAAAGRRRVSRVPIRIRLTAAFALAMVLVLAAAGTFVYLRLARKTSNESVDAALQVAGRRGARVGLGLRLARRGSRGGLRASRQPRRTGPRPARRRVAPRGGRRGGDGRARRARHRSGHTRAGALGRQPRRCRRTVPGRPRRDARQPRRVVRHRRPHRGAARLPARLRAGRDGAAPGRGDAPACGGGLARRRCGPPSLAGGARRDPPARRDAQRDARAAAAVVRARAQLRGRRQPRAAHTGGGHQDRDRGGAAGRPARSAGARGARGVARGMRPPRATRGGSPGGRARRRG